jgi:hypothetical protein
MKEGVRKGTEEKKVEICRESVWIGERVRRRGRRSSGRVEGRRCL